MKKGIKIIALILALLIVSVGMTYLSMGFVSAEFNPYKWTPPERGALIGISLTIFLILIVCCSGVFYEIIHHERP